MVYDGRHWAWSVQPVTQRAQPHRCPAAGNVAVPGDAVRQCASPAHPRNTILMAVCGGLQLKLQAAKHRLTLIDVGRSTAEDHKGILETCWQCSVRTVE